MQIEAVRLEAKGGRTFAREFPEQFVLAREPDLDLPGWIHFELAGVHLYRAPGATTKNLVDKKGKPIGWLLGHAVDGLGQYVHDKTIVPTVALDTDGFTAAETWAEALAGRYVVIFALSSDARLYQDPVGDFSVVWDPDTGIVASSILLALTRPMRWNPRFDRRGVLNGNVHFSLGHTADEKLRRMTPNHYLDLYSLRLVRHWPRSDTQFEITGTALEDQVSLISDRLGTILRSLVTNLSALLPISGGRDSRNLAGLLGDAAPELVSGFAVSFHKMSHIDSKIGAAIALRLGVPFQAVGYKCTTRQERLGYYRRVGYSDGGAALRVLGSHLTLPSGHVSLRGNVMELLRANQWNEATIRRRGVARTAFGLRRLLIDNGKNEKKTIAGFADEYEAWVATLPKVALKRQLDFGFCEQLLPNTLGVRHFGYTSNFVINPFACRELIKLAIQIPAAQRKADLPNQLLLERNCSALADIPFEREVSSGALIPE